MRLLTTMAGQCRKIGPAKRATHQRVAHGEVQGWLPCHPGFIGHVVPKCLQVALLLVLLTGGLIAAPVANDSPSSDDTTISADSSTTGGDSVVTDSPRELSVPPLDHKTYPASRPEWIDGRSSSRRMVVESGPWDDRQTAVENLDALIPAAVRSLAFGVVDVVPNQFDPLGDRSMDSYIGRRYVGTLTVGDSEQHEAVAEIVFDDEDVRDFQQRAKSDEVMHRIAAVGVCTGGGVVVLLGSGGVFGLLDRRRRRNGRSPQP